VQHVGEDATILDVLSATQKVSLATVGVVIGMVGALAAAPLLRSLLNGVSPRDPLTFVAIALILLTATFVASWIPAHRATRVDPNMTLRWE
jgi:putative ABC transport system permease protein